MEWAQAEPWLGSGCARDGQPQGLPTCSVPAQLCCWLLASAVLAARPPPHSWPGAACPSPSTGMAAPLCAAGCSGLAAAVPVPGLLETVGAGWHCLPPPRPRASVGSGAGLSPAAWFWDTRSHGSYAPLAASPRLGELPVHLPRTAQGNAVCPVTLQLVMPQKHGEPVVPAGSGHFPIVTPGWTECCCSAWTCSN